MWIIYRDKSLPIATLWTVAMLTLGFFAGSLYTLSPYRPAAKTGANSGWERMPDKACELLEKFRAVAGKVGLLDTILPRVLFLLLNRLAGFNAAMIGALGLSFVIAILRLRLGQSLLYAVARLGSVGLAVALALLLGRSQGFFLPGIVNGGVTVALALVSLLIRKPMVAWTSYLARRCPLDW